MTKPIAGDFMSYFMRYNCESESPSIYLRWAGLSAIAACTERKIWLDWGMDKVYANLYVLLVGPPGLGRKGTAMAPMRRVLETSDITLAPDSVTREQLIAEMSEATKTANLVKGELSMVHHSSMSVIAPEFAIFIGHNNLDFMANLIEMYDCSKESFVYNTKTQGKYEILGHWLNMISATTPSQIQDTLSLEQVGTGLTSRIIFVYSTGRRKIVPCPVFPMTEKGSATLDKLQNIASHINSIAGSFRITEAYRDTYIDFYKTMEETCPFDPDRFSAYWSRRQVHVRKLSMLYALSRGAGRTDDLVLRKRDFVRSKRLLEETERHMPQAFSMSGADPMAKVSKRILAFIMRRKEVTAVDLLREFRSDVDVKGLSNILKTLAAMKYVVLVNKSGGLVVRILEVKKENEGGTCG